MRKTQLLYFGLVAATLFNCQGQTNVAIESSLSTNATLDLRSFRDSQKVVTGLWKTVETNSVLSGNQTEDVVTTTYYVFKTNNAAAVLRHSTPFPAIFSGDYWIAGDELILRCKDASNYRESLGDFRETYSFIFTGGVLWFTETTTGRTHYLTRTDNTNELRRIWSRGGSSRPVPF